MKIKNVTFYRGEYILTLGHPVVLIHAQRDKNNTGLSVDVFVLYPRPTDRNMTWQHQRIEYVIDPESVEMPASKLSKKDMIQIAKQEAVRMVQGVKEGIRKQFKIDDPQLLKECLLSDCSGRVLIDLWLGSFTRKAFEELEGMSRSPELNEFLQEIFRLPQPRFENPYSPTYS